MKEHILKRGSDKRVRGSENWKLHREREREEKESVRKTRDENVEMNEIGEYNDESVRMNNIKLESKLLLLEWKRKGKIKPLKKRWRKGKEKVLEEWDYFYSVREINTLKSNSNNEVVSLCFYFWGETMRVYSFPQFLTHVTLFNVNVTHV